MKNKKNKKKIRKPNIGVFAVIFVILRVPTSKCIWSLWSFRDDFGHNGAFGVILVILRIRSFIGHDSVSRIILVILELSGLF
jgi:hypothetical protein